MTDESKHDPWYWALRSNRDYLTPEDISEAIDNGNLGDANFIRNVALAAIADKCCEDPSLCAWVAMYHKKPT